MRWLDGISDSMDMGLNKLWDGEGQGSQACCSPWGHKESDMTKWLNNKEEVEKALDENNIMINNVKGKRFEDIHIDSLSEVGIQIHPEGKSI